MARQGRLAGLLGGGGGWRNPTALPREGQEGKKTRADAGKKAEPKYRDPKTGETWSGRGRPAGWLKAYLDAGKKKEDFLIKK